MSTSNPKSADIEDDSVSLTVQNLGGIERADVTLDPGINILAGRNATNRTSLLAALGSALGGSTASLKSDTEEGHVSLKLANQTYQREYSRTKTGVQVTGNGYSDQEALVDHYVTLFETNPARQAVERGDDLREVIMQPVDTEEIQARVADLEQQKRAIKTEIEQVNKRRSELPELVRRREELTAELDDIDQHIETLREDVADFEADIEAAEEATEVVDQLNTVRQTLSSLKDELEVKQAERDALRDDIAEVELELEDMPSETAAKLSAIEEDLNAARSQKQDLDNTIASLTTIVDFNADLLNGSTELPTVSTDTDEVVSELAPQSEQDIVCWTCGSQVQRGDISEQLTDLKRVIEEKRVARKEVEGRIDDLQEEKRDLEDLQTRASTLEGRLEEMRTKVANREEEIEDLQVEIQDLEAEIEQLEQEAAETEELRETDLLEKYEQLSDLQYEKGQLQQQLSDLSDGIDEIESLPSEEELESQHAELQEELERERARVAELEKDAVEAFNTHMEELISLLEYENLSRVWIEWKAAETRSSAETDSQFELHIVRETSDGAGYEDQIENLSESERKVIGLVFALAGYLVHDVHEEVPFILLDSVEAIDAQRIADLIEYFADFVPYLVVALLPEDASSLEGSYTTITGDTLLTEP